MTTTHPTDIAPLRVLSLGGGTQSCALALMSAAGELPRLDAVVFADTQGELPETYTYLGYLSERLDQAGIPLHIVTAGSLEQALLGERMPANPTPPAYLARPGKKPGRILSYRCSYDFKRRVVVRELKRLCGGRGAWKRSNVEQWMGYSYDETHRMKDLDGCRCGHNRTVRRGKTVERIHTEADGCLRCACVAFDPWAVNRYPLIEMKMQRADTIAWFAANGHPTPPRSACWFCPNSRNGRWVALRSEHPDLFERACEIDDHIRTVPGFPDRGRQEFGIGTRLYLHEDRIPLRQVHLGGQLDQLPLFDDASLGAECDAGSCFT